MLEETIIKLKKNLNSMYQQSDKIIKLESQNNELIKRIKDFESDLENKNGESKALVISLRNQLL